MAATAQAKIRSGDAYVRPSSRLPKNWFYYWLLDNWKITSGEFAGSPYRFFPNYPFMEAVAKDPSTEIVAMKSAQVGFTELMIAKWYAYADELQGNLMYVLPTDELAKTLARARIKEAHSVNGYLEKNLTGFDTLQQFKFKNNYMYIRGSQTQIRDGRQYQRQLISIDASRLFGDEFDEWNHGVFGKLQSRIGASLDPIAMYFSTPRLVDAGVSKLFAESDAKVWSIKCRKCNHWNVGLTLQDNVTDHDRPDARPHKFICSKCKREMNRLEYDHKYSQWVAERPNSGNHRSGYHFSKLFFRAANLDTIVDRFNDPETVQECWNDDLGLPYQPKAYNITDETLLQCAAPSRADWKEIREGTKPRTIGIDMGKTIHYHVRGWRMDKPVCLEVGSVQSFDQIKEVIYRYNIPLGVIDAQPDFLASINFAEEMKKRGTTLKVAYFDTRVDGSKDRVLLQVDNKNQNIVVVARNYAMSEVMFEVVSGKVILPWEVLMIDNGDFAAHMRVPVRTYKEHQTTGQMMMHFPKSRRPDHHYFAYVYALVANELVEEEAHVGRRRLSF